MNIEIVLFPGFDELDAFAPYEVLRNAAKRGADLQTQYVTVDGSVEVVAAHGTAVRAAQRLGQPDLLIVPGGGWAARSAQGVRAEADRGALPMLIARAHESGVIVASVCTGAMLLAAAGLTQGRAATTHHSALDDLRASGAEIIAARVVDDGDVVTSGGVTSGLDLALWLTERFFGPQVALAVEHNLEYERRGTVWRRASTQ